MLLNFGITGSMDIRPPLQRPAAHMGSMGRALESAFAELETVDPLPADRQLRLCERAILPNLEQVHNATGI